MRRHYLKADCYYEKSSFRFMNPLESEQPDSDAVHAECAEVLAKLKTIFTFYVGKEPGK